MLEGVGAAHNVNSPKKPVTILMMGQVNAQTSF